MYQLFRMAPGFPGPVRDDPTIGPQLQDVPHRRTYKQLEAFNSRIITLRNWLYQIYASGDSRHFPRQDLLGLYYTTLFNEEQNRAQVLLCEPNGGKFVRQKLLRRAIRRFLDSLALLAPYNVTLDIDYWFSFLPFPISFFKDPSQDLVPIPSELVTELIGTLQPVRF